MIAKGVTHRDGAVLARYLVTGKEREQAELWELRGFACTGIVSAFRSVHVMAAATKCRAPFFHVSARSRPEECLDRSQWEYVANLIERMLGLTDQPRAIAFHVAEDSGQSHMHIAWSRIDQETLTAKPLPFFKMRLKQVCRQLEERFGLTPVPNVRESGIRFAPTRAEEEQARRLDVDIHATRETIRDCFERSDCGRSFRDALAQEGFVLARGDRRDFLVVDGAGGIHALGKRILGVSAAEVRNWLADLSAYFLPTIQQVRALLVAHQQAKSSLETADTPHHEISVRNPVRQVKAGRHARHEKSRAAGKKTDLDTERIAQPTADVVLPLVGSQPPCPPATEVSIETKETPIDEFRNETSVAPGDSAQSAERVRIIDSPQEQSARAFPCAETAPPEPPTRASPQIEQPPAAYQAPGQGARLRDRFRAVVKQLTAKISAPRPTFRKRRREEIGRGFRKAAWGLLRSVARIPPLHFLDPMWEPFTWLRLWESNDPPITAFHQEHSASTLSNRSSHL